MELNVVQLVGASMVVVSLTGIVFSAGMLFGIQIGKLDSNNKAYYRDISFKRVPPVEPPEEKSENEE